LPFFPGSAHVNNLLAPLNHTPFIVWLQHCHHSFTTGLHYGQSAYEGNAGVGCGVGLYVIFLLAGCWFVKRHRQPSSGVTSLPLAWRLAPWAAWISFLVLLAKRGSSTTPRNAATFFLLLVISLLLLPRVAAFERQKITALASGLASLMVVPLILLTPARPVIPVERLAEWFPNHALKSAAAKYHFWTVLRDDLAPIRDQFPADATVVGFAGHFRDTPYGLWKPFGSRVIVELGLPPGSNPPLPPGLKYAVADAEGILERYNMKLDDWLARNRGKIIFQMPRNIALTAEDTHYETWYLIQFQQ